MSLKLDDESLKTLQEGKGKNSVRSKSNSPPCQWDFFCFAALPFFSFKYSLATSFPEICLWRQSLWTPPFIVHRLWCVCVGGGLMSMLIMLPQAGKTPLLLRFTGSKVPTDPSPHFGGVRTGEGIIDGGGTNFFSWGALRIYSWKTKMNEKPLKVATLSQKATRESASFSCSLSTLN